MPPSPQQLHTIVFATLVWVTVIRLLTLEVKPVVQLATVQGGYALLGPRADLLPVQVPL